MNRHFGFSQTMIVAFLVLVGGMGGGLVFPIVPALGLELGLSGFVIGLVLSANRISRLIFNIVAGRLFARLGARRTLAGSFVVLTIGMLMLNVALITPYHATWLFAGRFVNGVGLAFLMIGAQAALLHGADRHERGKRSALFRTAFNASLPLGLVLGGVLADTYSDGVAFLAGAVMSMIGFALSFLIAPLPATDADHEPRVSASYRSLFNGPNRVALIAASLANFIVFISVQGSLLATLVLLVQQRGITVFGMDAQGTSSIAMALMVGMAAALTIWFGTVLDRTRLRSTLLFPSALGMSLGFFLIAEAQGLPLLLAGAVLVGISHNFVTVTVMALLADWASDNQQAPAVAVFQTAGDIGGTIGPMAGLMLALRFGVTELYLGLAALSLVCFCVALWLRWHESRGALATQG